jgi:probable 2-oxoglutarate dehydrogenase E1 component DHKTD1
MAYEYGYSLESPKNLCMWEAQFGDFYNPAQLMIDQYLQCSEAKWLRQSGLVLLLPHGFDGAGPEHSTCHIERFLQNINSNAYDTMDTDAYMQLNPFNINFQVANMTTPANYFHILRRQMHRNFRKPLVIAAPKVGLKHPMAVSSIGDMATGTNFQPILVNHFGDQNKDVDRVVICSGKVYFDMSQKLAEADRNVKVIRVEQLAPFPSQLIQDELSTVNKDVEVTWV